jgi:hypothetical protein
MACGSDAQGWTSVMLLFLLIAPFQTFAIAVSANMSGRSIVEEEIGIAPAMPESEIVRNCTEATQTSRNGYSRVSM